VLYYFTINLFCRGFRACNRAVSYIITHPVVFVGPLIFFRPNVSTTPLTMTLLFIHLLVILTTGPKFLPQRALHRVRSRAWSFKCEYPLLSSRPSNSFLRLLLRIPVTYIPPFIFPSITCRRRQFLCKM
jgi:hypothetical protein